MFNERAVSTSSTMTVVVIRGLLRKQMAPVTNVKASTSKSGFTLDLPMNLKWYRQLILNGNDFSEQPEF